MSSLGATILGEAFPHLFHFVLPDSRWEYAESAVSDSFKALLVGCRRASRRWAACRTSIVRTM